MKEIPLYGGKVALVDDEDYWTLMQHKWSEGKYRRRGQVYAHTNDWPYLMHLFVMRNVDKEEYVIKRKQRFVVDHIDDNPLNNQRNNLRWTTSARNIQRQPKLRGRSKYKGVCYLSRLKSKPWRAEIVLDRHKKHLGYFATEEEAARAYDEAALEFFGHDAGLNFPVRVGG